MKKKARSSQRSIRFDVEQVEKLEALSKKYNVDTAQIVRWATDGLIHHAERHGGKLTLPVEFTSEDLPPDIPEISLRRRNEGKAQ